MTDDGLEIARGFACALDTEAYDEAAALLDSGCVYDIRGDRHVGPDAIVASYRGNGDDAAEKFDGISYGSDVRRDPNRELVISFWDRIEHLGRVHEHRCEQVLSIGKNRLIQRIVHRDLPGEVEKLASFKASLGLGP